MKKDKLFCKLLSIISGVSMAFFGSTLGVNTEAISCEKAVEYLASNSIHLAFGEDFWLFGGERVGVDCAWQRFMGKMGKAFKYYMVDTWVEMDPDSANFSYLVLHVYQESLKKVSPKDAEEVVRNMWRCYRNGRETANDRIVLNELSEAHPELEFKKLKSIFDTI